MNSKVITHFIIENAVGHGAFMIASNGMKYSHTEKT